MHKYYRYYRDLEPIEKTIAWLIVLSTLYLFWQAAIRPFWNS